MMTHMTLGALLRHHREAASLYQAQLGEKMDYSHTTISRIERNLQPPTEAFLEQFVELLHLSPAESQEIWRLYHKSKAPETSGPSSRRVTYESWGRAPDVTTFYGRQNQLTQLEEWIMTDHCRLIGVLGIRGMGKTVLVTKLAQQLKSQFDYLFWCSLQNGPLLSDILEDLLHFLAPLEKPKSDKIDRQLLQVVGYLRQYSCLIVLDSWEGVLQAGGRAGYYQTDLEAYGELLQVVGRTDHRSCVVVTSEEKPKDLASLESEVGRVHSLQLTGLSPSEGRCVLQDKGLVGQEEVSQWLIQFYSGNPLLLQLVAEPIREIFGGDIGAFLAHGERLFGDVRDMFDRQFIRLSPVEQEIISQLAVAGKSLSLTTLQTNIKASVSKLAFLEAVASLQRRSLIESIYPNIPDKGDIEFTLQQVIVEYIKVTWPDKFTRRYQPRHYVLSPPESLSVMKPARMMNAVR